MNKKITLKQEEGAGNIDLLKRKSTYGQGKGPPRNPKKVKRGQPKQNSLGDKCRRCGREKHS